MKQNFLRKYLYWLGFITLANFIYGFFNLFFDNGLMDIIASIVTIPEIIMLVVSVVVIVKIKKHKLGKKYMTIPLVFSIGYIALVTAWSIAEANGMDTENPFATGNLFFHVISFIYYGGLSFASFYTLFSDKILKKLDTNSSKTTTKGKKEVKGVAGWLGFFVFTLAIAVPLNLMVGISDVFSVINDPELTLDVILFVAAMDALLFAGIIFFAIYSIVLLVRQKPNAVAVAKMYLIILFVSNLFSVVMSTITGESAGSDVLDMTSGVIIRSLFYSLIWFLYLSLSKRVKNTYPPEKRKLRPFDKITFVIILAIPVTIYALAFIGLTLPEEEEYDNSPYVLEWQELTSVEDSFRVQFPSYPFYEEGIYDYPDLATFLSYKQYGSGLEDGTEYYVIITEYPADQSFNDDKYNLEAAVNSRVESGYYDLLSSEETTFGDNLALDYYFEEIEDGYFLKGRFIMKDDILYDLMVAYDPGEFNESHYDKFIYSFEILE